MDKSQTLQQIQISPSLEEIIRVGVVFLQSMTVGKESAALRRHIYAMGEEIRRTIGDRAPSELDAVTRSRRLYKQVGIDPTKERPSSEKLLRRVLKDRTFPRVNDFVDAMNTVSLRLQFPLCFYDWDQVVPPVLIRIGRPDERFQGLGGNDVNLQGKIALIDGEGPFGNPTHDSDRTRISARTVRALVIAFAPADTSRAALKEVVDEIPRVASEYCSARLVVSGILPIR